MRLMLVCAALCVACPINTSDDRQKWQEPHPQAAAAVGPFVLASYPAPDVALNALFGAETLPQEGFARPDASEETIAPDAAEPERTFSRRELCSTAAAVAKTHDLPV